MNIRRRDEKCANHREEDLLDSVVKDAHKAIGAAIQQAEEI